MDALLIMFFLSGFVALLGSIVVLGFRSHRPLAFAHQPAQAHPIPFRRHTVLFSKAERSLYQALRTLVPDHMIFVKVKLADLVSLKSSKSFWDYFSPLHRKQIDFVVCDQTLAPVLAIELDDAGRHGLAANSSDSVRSLLETASLPVVHLPHKRRYLFSDIRRLLLPYLTVPYPLV